MPLIVRPIQAFLTRDTELIGRMDPYCKICIGGEYYRTATCEDGGQKPFWSETFTFHQLNDPVMRVEIYDDDVGPDDYIASGIFNLAMMYNQPAYQKNQFVDLTYKGQNVGRIEISFMFAPNNGGFNQCQNNNAW